ncbi:MAG: glycosyltransferase family 39 protein [Candidatus Omnitrophota bacterium]
MKNLLRFFSKHKYTLLIITFFIIFICGLIAKTPFKEAFEYNRDEGAALIKSTLLLNGFSLYKEIWYDQPPLFPVILSYWFKFFGSSIYHARILVLIFSFLLLSAFYFIIKIREGRFCAFIAVIFLLLSTGYLLLSVSVMRGIPALSLAMVSILFLTLYRKLYLKRFLILSGIFMALSLQTKLSGFFLIPIIILEIIQVKRQSLEKHGQNLSSAFLWLIAMVLAFLSINILFFHLDFQMFVQQLLQPHLNNLPFLKNNFSVLWKMLQDDFDIALLALTGIILIIKQRRRESFFPLIWLAMVTIMLLKHKPIWYSYYPLISIPICWLGAINFAKFFSKSNLYTRISRKFYFSLIILPLAIFTIFQLPSKYQRTQKSLLGRSSAQERRVLDVLSKYKKNTRWIFTDRAIFAFYSDIFVPPELVLISIKRILTNKLEPGYLINKLEKYKPELILLTGYLETFPGYYSKIIPYIEKNYNLAYKNEFLSPKPVPPGSLLIWFKEPIGKYLPPQIRHINNKGFYNLIWNSLQIPIPRIYALPNWVDSKTKIKILTRKDILQRNNL